MFFKKLFSTALFCSAMFFIGCSDDSTSPSGDNNTIPTGNITEDIFTFANVKKYVFAESTIDSLFAESNIVTGTLTDPEAKTIFEKACTKFNKNYDDESNFAVEYYSVSEDKNSFYVFSNSINDMINKMALNANLIVNLPFELEEMWVKVGDRVNTSWDIHSQQFTDFILTTGATTSGTLTVKAKRGVKKELTVNSVKHPAYQFIITFAYTGTTSLMEQPISLSFNIEYYFVKELGLMMYQLPRNVFDLVIMKQPVPGFRNKVTNFELLSK